MTQHSRLSKDDWIAAGFRALAESGPKALNINALAKNLSTTKGSFYWHFKDLSAYKSAILSLWKDKVATEIMAGVMDFEQPNARFDALIKAAIEPPPETHGGRKIEPAMRAWALSDSEIAAALEEIDHLRIGFLRQLLQDMGHQDPALPELVYAAYIGTDDLASKGRSDIAAALTALGGLLKG